VHVCWHTPEQPQLQPFGVFSAAFTIVGMLDNITMPKTGRIPFPAFLKKSLRDWNSSFLFFAIVIKINALQNSREQAVDKYWIDTKKERGSLYFSLIPSLQGSLIASAPEISNADSPRRSTL